LTIRKSHLSVLAKPAPANSAECDNPFCRSLTPETREMLCALKSPAGFQRRKEVCFYPEKQRRVMLIRHGQVFIIRERFDGRQKGTECLAPGDIIGVTRLFGTTGGTPIRMYAKLSTEVCAIPLEPFERMVMDRPDVAKALIKRTIARFAAAISQLEHMTLDTSQEKILYTLETLSRRDAPLPVDPLPVTHRELAILAGVNRITATRVLEQLRSEASSRISGSKPTPGT
jgi:CRP/FNR family cyclic AMP-dependent transcriptional regulator